jgi:5-methylcytosine-specific restriction endonuclease McrA
MSWAKRSYRPWQRVRVYVLARDGELCQVQGPRCLGRAPIRASGGIPAGEAHHVQGRSVTGDDPEHMVAACRACNQHIGDPTKHDPDPEPRTQWEQRT